MMLDRFILQNPVDQEILLLSISQLQKVPASLVSVLTLQNAPANPRASSPAFDPSSWDPSEVGEWLALEDLGLHQKAFVGSKIDGKALLRIQEPDLVLLGVKVG